MGAGPRRTTAHRSGRVWLLWLVLAMPGCVGGTAATDPGAARQLLRDALDAWKNGRSPEDLKQQSPPVYVVDQRWLSGRKLKEFTVVGDGQYHGASLRCTVRMRLDGDAKPREYVYWVSTNPAHTVTLAD